MLTNLGSKIFSVTNEHQIDVASITSKQDSSLDQTTNNNNQIVIESNQSPYGHLMSQTGSDITQHQVGNMDVSSNGQLQSGVGLNGNGPVASGNQQHQSLATNTKQTIQHSIQSLQPLTRYSIRVSAINSIGKSSPSVALDIRTEEEGKFTCLFLYLSILNLFLYLFLARGIFLLISTIMRTKLSYFS